MPSLDEKICDNLLGKKKFSNKYLDRKLKATYHVNSILNSIIQFIPAKRQYEEESKELKWKYFRLNSSSTTNTKKHRSIIPPSSSREDFASSSYSANPSTSKLASSNVVEQQFSPIKSADIPAPSFDIFPAERVRLNWEAKLKRSTAVGLHNLGNTCFLNSILQILTNTAPLANYLLNNEHNTNQCPSSTGFCALCLTRNHVQRVFACSSNATRGGAISPNAVVSKVRCFMKSYSFGRQEDAHEFLRYFIDSMQNAALYGHKGKKLDLHTKETSVIGRIFGGYLKNEVTCNKCRYSSITFDPFLDISLEVKQQLNSLEAALSHFTRPETLTNDNAYKCPKCKVKVSARKMFTIHQAPNILTIQFKRFNHHAGKIDRFVSYPEKLSLRPYMTEKQGCPVNYKLYGVVVHRGRSTRSGHYYSFVRNPCDQWHVLDDSSASPVSPNVALKSSGAYLLFYIRVPTPVAAVKPQQMVKAMGNNNNNCFKTKLDDKHQVIKNGLKNILPPLPPVRTTFEQQLMTANGGKKKNGSSISSTPTTLKPKMPAIIPAAEQQREKPAVSNGDGGNGIVENGGKSNGYANVHENGKSSSKSPPPPAFVIENGVISNLINGNQEEEEVEKQEEEEKVEDPMKGSSKIEKKLSKAKRLLRKKKRRLLEKRKEEKLLRKKELLMEKKKKKKKRKQKRLELLLSAEKGGKD